MPLLVQPVPRFVTVTLTVPPPAGGSSVPGGVPTGHTSATVPAGGGGTVTTSVVPSAEAETTVACCGPNVTLANAVVVGRVVPVMVTLEHAAPVAGLIPVIVGVIDVIVRL